MTLPTREALLYSLILLVLILSKTCKLFKLFTIKLLLSEIKRQFVPNFCLNNV